jgi:hypothetical protein
MSTTEPIASVTAIRRPAVHASTLVRSDVEHTFQVFVRTIATWWPVQRLSAGGGRVHNVTFERQVGGHVYETWDDGSTVEWGQLSAWDPPHRFVMSWNSTPAPTDVELVFTALGPALTRVTVEHRGWDRLTDEQLVADCAEPGGYGAGGYDTGWTLVLASFARAVHTSARDVEITDDYMKQMLSTTREYTFVLLSAGPRYGAPGSDTIIWEHGRRNFQLRAQGLLALVCPVLDDTSRCGVGIFNADVEDVEEIMRGDPGVQAGVFVYEIHPVRSFPGDGLSARR